MNIAEALVIILTIFGLVAFLLEDYLHVDKAYSAMIMCGSIWIIAFGVLQEAEMFMSEGAFSVFEIVVYLVAALHAVVMLERLGLFLLVDYWIAKNGWSQGKLFFAILTTTFLLSACLDNVATAVIMFQISREFFTGHNKRVVTVGIVVFANAGGAWSPIGDTTTLMLWLADKFSASQIILEGFLPAATLAMVVGVLLYRKLSPQESRKVHDLQPVKIPGKSMFLIGVVLTSFLSGVVLSFNGTPPFIPLAAGVGVTAALISVFQHQNHSLTPTRFSGVAASSNLDRRIEVELSKQEWRAILFILFLLTAVEGIKAMDVLNDLSSAMLGLDPTTHRYVGVIAALGMISAFVDNIGLTAMIKDTMQTVDPSIWALFAAAIGTGGSVLPVGSLPGIIATQPENDLSVMQYIRIGTVPVLVGYAALFGAWYLQRLLFIS